jgi:hypothetical protein
MRLISLAAFALIATASITVAAPEDATVVESRPGSVAIGQSTTETGTITAINKGTREVTLTMPDGDITTVTCGPEVKNFDQLMVGDAVEIQFARALALDLKKGSTAEISRTVESGVASAEPGAKPGAAGGMRVHIVAEVTAVDAATQTITLRGPERTVDLRINDPEQFKNIAVGDRIEATYVEAIAVAVNPTKAVD